MKIANMIADMGFVGWCVMGFLLMLSIYAVSVSVDKHRRFSAARREARAFLDEFARCLREGKLNDAAAVARRHDRSHVARVVVAGIDELMQSKDVTDVGMRVELVSNALERSAAVTISDMKKGLGGLATIGSTAPFVGLFGTVVGIIHSFEGIAATGSGGLAAVSGGIAEALVATALGIQVAIPAVWAFNYFTGSLETFHIEMKAASAELVGYLNRRMQVSHAGR